MGSTRVIRSEDQVDGRHESFKHAILALDWVMYKGIELGRSQQVWSRVRCGARFGCGGAVCWRSGLQIYYLFSANIDGTDEYCERLGWKRLQDYNLSQRRWKNLNYLAQGKMVQEDTFTV
ncbi:hypothetical protein AgCh_029621 [Apium graveolens]